jgi:hypothetical protein
MPYRYPQYVARSGMLLNAAEQLRAALADKTIEPASAIDDLISASRQDAGKEMGLRYAARTIPVIESRPASPEDALSAILLDIQSANLLMSAGLALKETGAPGDVMLFDEAVTHLEGVQSEIKRDTASQRAGFLSEAVIHSGTLDSAKLTFKTNSDSVLEDFVEEAAKVINSVVEQLKKLDPGKVLEAIDKLGRSISVVARAGRLIRVGIEKLKSAIDALTALFGNEAFKTVKDSVAAIWKKFVEGQYTRDLLKGIFDVGGTLEHIAQVLERPNMRLDAVDAASNALVPLARDYQRNMRLLRGLIAGIGLAVAILGYFQMAVAWLPVAAGAAYVGVIAGMVLIGMEYCGSTPVLHWVHGVHQIAEQI